MTVKPRAQMVKQCGRVAAKILPFSQYSGSFKESDKLFDRKAAW